MLGGGEVEVREEGLALSHPVVLLGDRLLDLEDQVAGVPHCVGRRQDRGARGDVVRVRDRRPHAGVLLDVHLVALTRELVRAGWRDRDAVLVVLDFAWDADLHG